MGNQAGWNAVVNVGVAVTLVSSVPGAIGAPAIPFVGPPRFQRLRLLIASVVLHTAYKLLLARAYQAGDVVRGVVPLLAAMIGCRVAKKV